MPTETDIGPMGLSIEEKLVPQGAKAAIMSNMVGAVQVLGTAWDPLERLWHVLVAVKSTDGYLLAVNHHRWNG